MERFEFDSICRLCVRRLETEQVSPIFNNELYVDKISLPERIRYCSSVEVFEGDGLPPQICGSCLMKLNDSFIFRNQCVLSDIALKHLVNKGNVEMSIVTNLLKIDIANDVIKSDMNYKQIQVIELIENEDKNNLNFVEFNDNENGKHLKNMEEIKTNFTGKMEIPQKESEGDSKFFETLTPNKDEKAFLNPLFVECDNSKNEEEKPKVKILVGKKLGRISILKKRKEPDIVKNDTVKTESSFEKELSTEVCSVDPETFSFNEIKDIENTQNDVNVQVNLSDCGVKTIKKVVKPKSLGMKRGKKKKLTSVKEKPTSYTCKHCQKVYPSEGGWRYHLHTMHNKNYQPFICDLCGQAFKVKKNLEGHKNSIHYHLKLHLCDLCGRGFASKYALKVHKIWHNDERNFTCDICGTKFRTRGKMNTHKKIHGGPKKFMCHICSRDFRWKKDFEIHMRTHTGEKPFKCSHCGKAFASLTNMKKHERNHLQKLTLVKSSESFEVISTTTDERLFTNEVLDFGYGSEDVRNREMNQIQ